MTLTLRKQDVSSLIYTLLPAGSVLQEKQRFTLSCEVCDELMFVQKDSLLPTLLTRALSVSAVVEQPFFS